MNVQDRIINPMLSAFAVLLAAAAPAAAAGRPDRPKNVVVMISDGCGIGQIEAAEYFLDGRTGQRAFDSFPVRLWASTWSLNTGGYDPDSAWTNWSYVFRRPTDSAASATALATGVKTRNGYIGVDSSKAPVENALERAEKSGKATGVVTSVPFFHATPAGFSAHNRSRNDDEGLIREMVQEGALDVIMGCGHPEYDDSGARRPAADTCFLASPALWKALKSGLAGGDADRDGLPDPWAFTDSRSEFVRLGSGPAPKRLFGLASVAATLQQSRPGDPKADPFTVPPVETVPTLSEMTAAALNALSADPDGFFLMVEGGAVDWASHGGQTGRMIEEQAGFFDAVETVTEWIEAHGGWESTLLVITGDHETGRPTAPGADSLWNTVDLPGRGGVTAVRNRGKGLVPGVEWHGTGHTNAILPLFAKGPAAARFEAAASRMDPVRGRFLDNSDIGRILVDLAGPKRPDSAAGSAPGAGNAWRPQFIPGRVECEAYNKGGEGVAFHDSDASNSGSGGLNPANGNPLNGFRMDEAVDISFTKPGGVDDSPFNAVPQETGRLYVGWTEPGEWMNYTVDVLESGVYRVGLLYTSNRGGLVSLAVDGKKAAARIEVPSTFVGADTLGWTQWHHWNYLPAAAEIPLKKGRHVLRLTTEENGNMNYDCLDFRRMR